MWSKPDDGHRSKEMAGENCQGFRSRKFKCSFKPGM